MRRGGGRARGGSSARAETQRCGGQHKLAARGANVLREDLRRGRCGGEAAAAAHARGASGMDSLACNARRAGASHLARKAGQRKRTPRGARQCLRSGTCGKKVARRAAAAAHAQGASGMAPQACSARRAGASRFAREASKRKRTPRGARQGLQRGKCGADAARRATAAAHAQGAKGMAPQVCDARLAGASREELRARRAREK